MIADVHHSREMTAVTVLATIVDIAQGRGTARIGDETGAGPETAGIVIMIAIATEGIVMGVEPRIEREATAGTVATNDEVSASYAARCTTCSIDD